jgi:AbrB family looped-hinge helix DNA binding protein
VVKYVRYKINGKVFKKKRLESYGDILSMIDVVVSSANGNVSIPKAIRKKLHIAPGTKFAVVVEGDTLIFKKIQVPSTKEFEKLVDKGTKIAERNDIKEEDIEEIIHKHRGVNVD